LADLPELRGLADDELARRVAEVREELFRLRMQHATLQLDDTSRPAQVRREIAQILTVRRARKLTPEAASVDGG
jgi:large subunit ribosomal protein L29